jgi:hypothetical protein
VAVNPPAVPNLAGTLAGGQPAWTVFPAAGTVQQSSGSPGE